MNADLAPTTKMGTVRWLICIIAAIGFAFDIYELLMLPLIVRPALMELIGAAPGSPEFALWVGRLFYIPAFAGGIFGLLGGWLTDQFGRRRVLTFSILLYALAAFGAGFSTSVEMLLFFRCLVFIGVCVEFVAAVAWLAELFPDAHQREKVLGYTQAFSSIGGLLVAVANGLCIVYAASLPAIHLPDWLNIFGGEIGDDRAPWRYTLMSGIIPAIPLILIRPFLPESPAWKERKGAGTLRRPNIAELFATPELRRATLITTFMFACAFGAAFGAIQHMPRMVPELPEVKAEVQQMLTAQGVDPTTNQGAAKKAEAIASQKAAAGVTEVQEIGGLYGRFLFAVLVGAVLLRRRPDAKTPVIFGAGIFLLLGIVEFGTYGWTGVVVAFVGGAVIGWLTWLISIGISKVMPPTNRALIRFFQIPGLVLMPLVFGMFAMKDIEMLKVGMFVVALCTVAQFSFWGNYLPLIYPVHLRGTGESFAANIGGRLIGTSFAWVTSTLAVQEFMPGGSPAAKLAYTAAIVGFFVYLMGFILSFWLPEPDRENLPE